MSEMLPFRFAVDGLPVYVDRNIPLTRTKDDGTVEAALFWLVDGKVLVHPDRVAVFERVFAKHLPDLGRETKETT